MENIIFNYIGYGFLGAGALCVIIPLLIVILNGVAALIWYIVDEGDSGVSFWLKKIAPFIFHTVNIEPNGSYGFSIKRGDGRYLDRHKTWKVNFLARFNNEEEVKKEAESLLLFNVEPIFFTLLTLSSLGLGFLFIPTITLYLISTIGTLYALRWSRRGYKQVIKLKVSIANITKGE